MKSRSRLYKSKTKAMKVGQNYLKRGSISGFYVRERKTPEGKRYEAMFYGK